MNDTVGDFLYRNGTTLFFSFFRRQPLKLFFSTILMILAAFSSMVPAILVGKAIDILESEGFSQLFIFYGIGVLISGVFFYLISFIGLFTFVTLSFSFERDIRQEYFDTIQSHSLTFFDEHNSSHLLSMGMTEISQMRQGIVPALRAIMQNIFSVLFIVAAIYSIAGLQMTLITLVGFIVYYILAVYQARRITPVRMKLADTAAELTEQSQEIFRGIDVVRSFKGTVREILRFRKMSKRYSDLGIREGRMAAFYLPNLALLLLTAALFAMSVNKVTLLQMSVGDLIQVMGLLVTLQLTSMMMPQMLLFLNAAITNANRIWEKMNWQDPQPDKEITEVPEINWKGELRFENVTFGYVNSKRPALKNLSVSIPPGSKVALIGGPGSGKSTFLKLLLKLYVPQEGRITISGVDYEDIPHQIIRQHVSMVEQEVFLFSGTIRDNIAFARPDATDEEIMVAAEAAQAMEFISKLPKGLDTMIGERGVDLSGGQRQRIAIARAILADPDILLLDDSASALDSKTEELLRKALDNLSENRLTITVTQRLTTLLKADLIILLKRGSLLAVGKHDELLDKCMEYRRIFELLPESERILAKGGIQ